MRSIADDHDALLVIDEMITGFGRTGRYWGLDHSGARPDIVTIGKGLRRRLPAERSHDAGYHRPRAPLVDAVRLVIELRRHPLAAAAGSAALRVLDEEKLVDNARTVGAAMLRELEPFVDDYPFVGEVRGRGLLLAIELVRSKRTRQPLPEAVTRRIYDACVTRGLLAMTYTARVRLQPALTIDEATARNGIAILREVFDDAKRGGWWAEP